MGQDEDEITWGFNLSSAVAERIEMLMEIWVRLRAGSSGMAQHQVHDLTLSYSEGRMQRLNELSARGWVELGPHRSPIDAVELLPAGAAFGETIDHRRTTKKTRDQASRNAVLYWLYEMGRFRPGRLVVDPMGPHGSYLGSRFTEEEIFDAGEWLKEGGYVTSSGTWSRELTNPKITREGRQIVENNRSVNDPEPAAGGMTIGSQSNTFYGPGSATVANAGRDASVTSQATVIENHRQQVLALADFLEHTHPEVLQVDPDAGQRALEAVSDLRDGVSTGVVAKVKKGLATATDLTTQLGSAISSLALVAHSTAELGQVFGVN